MRNRSLLYLILWIILGLVLFRTCVQPDAGTPTEIVGGARLDTFDAYDAPDAETFVLENEYLWTEWSARGGGCRTIKLKDYEPTTGVRSELEPGEAEEQSEWVTLYRSVPAFPPRVGDAPTAIHHRQRDALRLWAPEGNLSQPLDALDWERQAGQGNNELVLTAVVDGIRFTRTVRLPEGARHFEFDVSLAAESEEGKPQDLVLRLGTGGGLIKVPDNYYPNPYAAAARLEHGQIDGVEQYLPIGGMPSGRRDAVEAWNGKFDFVVEGSKYFLSAIRPTDNLPFSGAWVEALYDGEAWAAALRQGIEPERYKELVAIGEADYDLMRRNFEEEGAARYATAEELANYLGRDQEEVAAGLQAWKDHFAATGLEFDADNWKRASVAGGFQMHVGQIGVKETRSFLWYLGPKDPSVLSEGPYEPFYAVIDDVDYGGTIFYDIFLTDLIAPVILWILRFFHGIVGNWGVAIILMTLLVRGCLFPIQRHSQIKMAQHGAKMAKVKPLLDAVKEKYKENAQKRNEETMKIYQQHKMAPPLGGCLPILLQFPVFIGLFAALRCSILLRQQPFTGWITDLSRPDALVDFGGPIADVFLLNAVTTFNVLPILMVILWVLHQKTMPKPVDPQQQQMMKMMTFMPILFGIFLYNYAAGLSLYMITSSLVGIFESKVIKKKWPIPKPGDAEAQPATS